MNQIDLWYVPDETRCLVIEGNDTANQFFSIIPEQYRKVIELSKIAGQVNRHEYAADGFTRRISFVVDDNANFVEFFGVM